MKKLLFLPLAAMLCFGCSKDAFQGDIPEIAKQEAQAQEYIEVAFNNYVSGGLTNNSSVEYVDEYGQHQTLYPTHLTTYINVSKTGYIAVNIFVDAPGGAYQTIKTFISASNGFYQDFTGVNPITGGATIGMAGISDDRLTVTLQAELE